MATYSQASYNPESYHSFRPTYPDKFYKFLLSYHDSTPYENNRELFLDAGCGTGLVTFPVAPNFTKAIGTDPSNTMISQCLKNEAIASSNISFTIASAEDLSSVDGLEPASLDLLTAAECVHWFKPPQFVEQAAKYLKPNGTLAYWLYVEPMFEDDMINKIYYRYVYGDKAFMGPLWDEGKSEFRVWLKQCTDLVFQDDRFKNIKFVKLHQDSFPETGDSRQEVCKTGVLKSGDEVLLIKQKFTLDAFMKLLSTFSPVHKWYKANPEVVKGSDQDLLVLMRKEFQEVGWTSEQIQLVVWDSMYVFAKRA